MHPFEDRILGVIKTFTWTAAANDIYSVKPIYRLVRGIFIGIPYAPDGRFRASITCIIISDP
jgi:hypothetical protein